MPKLLAIILPAVALLAHADPALGADVRQPAPVPASRPRSSSSASRVQVQRYAFDQAMVEPFVELWASRSRPDLPAARPSGSPSTRCPDSRSWSAIRAATA